MINNGGIIGPKNSPTSSAASGAWSLFEQATARKNGSWPTMSTSPTSVEYLVVAGGGGGGYAGGGAGGYRTASGLAVTSGVSYTVTVGAGGSSGRNSGSNSVFSSIISTGGGGGGNSNEMGNGGSGIVVIRYADTFPAASSTTGSPTYTVSGGFRIYRWTSSGSITW